MKNDLSGRKLSDLPSPLWDGARVRVRQKTLDYDGVIVEVFDHRNRPKYAQKRSPTALVLRENAEHVKPKVIAPEKLTLISLGCSDEIRARYLTQLN